MSVRHRHPSAFVTFSDHLPSIHNAGSFIRPSNSLCFGVSFLSALTAKYDEEPDPSEVNILFGTATGAVQVEAVGFDQVRKRLRAVERLRHVSLDNRYVASGDPPGRIRATCPSKSLP